MPHQVENLFATLKDWRGIATRYDRWAHIFSLLSSCPATLFFSLSLLSLRSSGTLTPVMTRLTVARPLTGTWWQHFFHHPEDPFVHRTWAF